MNSQPPAEPRAGTHGWVRQAILGVCRLIRERERELWILVIGALLVDFGLTVYGFHLGLIERNPVARGFISAVGIPGILALKGGALAVAATLRTLVPDEYGAMVPLILVVSWGYAALVNSILIASVLV